MTETCGVLEECVDKEWVEGIPRFGSACGETEFRERQKSGDTRGETPKHETRYKQQEKLAGHTDTLIGCGGREPSFL